MRKIIAGLFISLDGVVEAKTFTTGVQAMTYALATE
jgi:hypothetical protein